MKLKCNDGRTRLFYPSKDYGGGVTGGVSEASCGECGFQFGVHDLKSVKTAMRAHKCQNTPFLGEVSYENGWLPPMKERHYED